MRCGLPLSFRKRGHRPVWLAGDDRNGGRRPTIERLAGRLAAGSQDAPWLAAPGETMTRPAEEAVLKALGQASRAPEQAESLLGFLPGPQRTEVTQLLTELAEQLRASTTQRLRRNAQTT